MAAGRLKDFVKLGRTIVAVGRNYKAHAVELGNPIPTEPILFLKPVSSYVQEGSPIEMPERVKDLVYEVELGVVINSTAKNVSESNAMDYIGGYVLALDMTSRDIQGAAKKKGHPWTVAKGFDTFTPVSSFIDKDKVDLSSTVLWLKVDGVLKQRGPLSGDMIFSVPYLIEYITHIMTLEAGDVILTGTPKGAGSVFPGQTITAGIEGIIEMTFPVIAPQAQ
jgi:acylpyruvate hydrolase